MNLDLRRRRNAGALELAVVGGALLGAALLGRAVARRRHRFDFRGAVAVITGGSRGLGLVLARRLVREGARVALLARDDGELARARDDLESLEADVLAIACDITQPDQVEEALAQVRDQLGPVDVLINNAGVIQVGPMDEMTPEDYAQALRVHFWGPLHTVLGVLPDMRRRGAGRIVNISSIGGKISVPHLLPYSTSKFALAGFSDGLRASLAGEGIRVTTVFPGLMRTGSPRNASFKGRHHAEYAWFSVADSLPALSMSAEQAARRIIDACRHGDAELVMPLSAVLAVKANALAPGAGAAALSLADRLLPGPGGVGRETRSGAESESAWAPSPLTALGDAAARRNNEMGDP
ncbi:MAG TPA: SDR family oxidoreductase [Gemmatimonadales bacterium]|nr:SDR family oxidoreductase [Gemmatimonadales bacterium]